jgi:KipI family sensor histidine kinase inhibitor
LSPARIVPFGDAAVLIDLGYAFEGDRNLAAHRLAAAVRQLSVDGPPFGSPVPGLGNVLVPVDPEAQDLEVAIERLSTLAGVVESRQAEAEADSTVDDDEPPIELPTRYGGDHGPDLADVAGLTGLSDTEVIELHASVEYRVLFLGFAPGFAYLGDLPPALSVPRLATPRPRVPAGSVAIAGRQTAVYPFETPGGWLLIGRTDVPVWSLDRQSPALLTPGTRVRFVPDPEAIR